MSRIPFKQLGETGEAQGDILYFNGTDWVRLAAGTSGDFLRTNGAGADPAWATPAGGGDVSGPGSSTDNAVARWNGVTGTSIQNSGVIVDDNDNVSGVESLLFNSLSSDPASPAVGQAWFNSTAGLYRGRRTIAGTDYTIPFRVVQDNLSAGTDPTATDDQNSGYEVGSVWVNTTLGERRAFICVNAAAAAAEWRTLVRDGSTHGDILYFNGSEWLVLAPGTSGNVLQTNGAGAAPTWVTPAGGTPVDTSQWKLNGRITVITSVDGAWVPQRAGTITAVTLWRGTAGGAGSTTIDVNKNGTTIYTTQANRPSVTAASGDDATSTGAAAPDVTSFVAGDIFKMDVDAVETSNPLDLTVTFEVEYS